MSVVTPLGRSFNGLWFATGAANMADGMALFVLPLLAIASGATPGGVAAVTVVFTLAWPVFGVYAGWVVDRFDRRRLLGAANMLRAVAMALVTLSYFAGTSHLAVVLAAAAILGASETLVDTALTSTVPLVVGMEGRTRANARIEATINFCNQLAGPPIAGILAGATLALATGTSAFLYAVAVAGISAMALRRTDDGQPADVQLRSGLAAGFRFIWRQPEVRALTLYTAAMNIVWAISTALFVVYAVHPGPLGLSAAQFGFVLTAMAAGGLAIAMVVDRLRRRFGVTWLLIADCVGTVLLVAPVAAGLDVWAVVIGAVVAGAGASVWRILVAVIRQNLSPPELLGRVYSASRVISWGVIPAGAAAAGIGAELWGLRPVFAGATLVAVAVLVSFVPFALRHDLSGAVHDRT